MSTRFMCSMSTTIAMMIHTFNAVLIKIWGYSEGKALVLVLWASKGKCHA